MFGLGGSWANKYGSTKTSAPSFHLCFERPQPCYTLAFSVQDVSDLLNVLEAGGFESDPDFAKSPNKNDIDIR